MSDFKFADEPTQPEPATPPAEPAPPVAPQAPIAVTPGAPVVPSPVAPAPRAPSPAAPTPPVAGPQSPTPHAPAARPTPVAPQVPAPQVPLPNAAQPQAATQAPRAATPQAPGVPSPRPVAPQVPAAQVPNPQAPRPTSAPPTTPVRATAPSPQAPSVPAPAVPTPSVPMPNAATAAKAPTLAVAPSPNTQLPIHQDLNPRADANSSGASQGWRGFLEAAEPFAAWIFRSAAVFCVLGFAYLLLGLFSVHTANAVSLAAGAQKMHLIASNLVLSAKAANFCLILIGLSLLFLMVEFRMLGFILAIVGVGLRFGLPFLFFALAGKTRTSVYLTSLFQPAAMALLVVGLTKWAIDTVLWVLELPERMRGRADVGVKQQAEAAQQRVARDANAFSPCWKLPFCREVVRKQCPAYLAKKTCWKFGRGCYCDEEMISRIIRGESIDLIKAPTRMSRQGKPPCGRCYIFLEHQTHKFKLVSPITIPATILTMVLLWNPYTVAFGLVGKALAPLFNGLSFDPKSLAPDALKTDANNYDTGSLSTESVTHFAQIALGIFLGFFVLIYISKFIEWAIYKARW